MAIPGNVNRLPLVTSDTRIWEEQPWDTTKSYEAFFLYYFPQSPPRNLSAAYRQYKPLKSTKPDNRQAPSNWRRWASGQDTKGHRKYYRQAEPGGDIRVLPVPTWEERAKAWDDEIRKKEIRELETERENLLRRMRVGTRMAWEHLLSAWTQYRPTGQESLGELSSATRTLAATIDLVHDQLLTGEGDTMTDIQGEPDGTPITDIDRVNAIGDMVLLASRRKSEVKSTEGKNGRRNGQPPKDT